MNDFLNKFNEQERKDSTGALTPVGPFYGTPLRLPPPAQEELIYRYQFLEDSITSLASMFRLTPKALEEWLEDSSISQIQLDTPEAEAEFETHVNETYKQTRIKLSGLVTLHSARAWDSLAESETNLLFSLQRATHLMANLAEDGRVDSQELKRLIDSHAKLTDRQAILHKAIEIPAVRDLENTTDALTKSLKDLLDEIDGSSYKLPSSK